MPSFFRKNIVLRPSSILLSFVALTLCTATFGAPARAAVLRKALNAATALPSVNTQSGPVVGTTVQNMKAWEGIPFAAPPTGALRWEPPQPPAKWTTPRQATTFSSECPQAPSFFGIGSTNEDCLYLNVFAPPNATANSHLPVMVWFYGGAFIEGGADLYDPDKLVAQNVIVVTTNYRLGPFGFLATPQLDAEPHLHINYGLMDQQAALRWVRANIAAFGGDTSNTTIFGESAGGLSVFSQILSPLVTGLFQHAIIESGAYDIQFPTQAAAEQTGSAFASAVGCGTSTACLRALPASTILAQEPTTFSATTAQTVPSVDGTLIPEAPETALIAGSYNHVPLIQGTNHDEFRLFTALAFDLFGGAPLTAAEYPTATSETLSAAGLGADTQAVLAEYPLANFSSPDVAYSTWTTDSVFSTGAFLTDGIFTLEEPLFGYEFADPNPPQNFLPPVSFPYGAYHASEVQFLWDSFNLPSIHNTPLVGLSSSEAQLSANMVKYWTNFAKFGNPNGAGSPPWALFSATAGNMERFVPPSPSGPYLGFAADHKTAFWEALALQAAASTTALTGPQAAIAGKLPRLEGVARAATVLRSQIRFRQSATERLLLR